LRDRLTFTSRTVTSERLSNEGYGTTNYSVNIPAGTSVVWETMQTKAGEGVAFWRGELKGNRMEGVLNQQLTDGGVKEFSFQATNTAPKAPPPAANAAGESAPMAPPAVPLADPTPPDVGVSEPAPATREPPAAAPSAPEAPKQKKKGWLW
jgi:hypothetical protein